MTVLEFILGLFIGAIVFTLGIGFIAFKYDTKKLEEENKKLKEDLEKARTRRIKSEYKKVRKVK